MHSGPVTGFSTKPGEMLQTKTSVYRAESHARTPVMLG